MLRSKTRFGLVRAGLAWSGLGLDLVRSEVGPGLGQAPQCLLSAAAEPAGSLLSAS